MQRMCLHNSILPYLVLNAMMSPNNSQGMFSKGFHAFKGLIFAAQNVLAKHRCTITFFP